MTAPDTTVRAVLIGGEWRHGGGELLERFNPARPSEAVVRLQGATAAEVREAYAAAAAAAPGWRRTPGRRAARSSTELRRCCSRASPRSAPSCHARRARRSLKGAAR